MNVNKWSGVAIAMQSALAATKTITAITKANPGVVSSTAHGYSNGDLIVLDVTGMRQVDGRVFRVSSVATDSFSLEGEDTTLFDTFSAGTAAKLTMGTTLGTTLSITGSGGEFSFISTTTIHDTQETQIPGLPSSMKFEMEHIWDVADAALVAMKSASQSQAQRAFKFTFATGQIMLFTGYVGTTLSPGGSTQDKVTTSVVITAFGSPTYYSA